MSLEEMHKKWEDFKFGIGTIGFMLEITAEFVCKETEKREDSMSTNRRFCDLVQTRDPRRGTGDKIKEIYRTSGLKLKGPH